MLIFFIRVSIGGCLSFAYQLTYILFPPLLRSKAYAIANGSGKMFSVIAPLLVLFKQPMVFEFVIGLSYIVLATLLSFSDKDMMSGFGGKKDFKKKDEENSESSLLN